MTVTDAPGLSSASSTVGRLQRAAYRLLLEHEADGTLSTSIRFLFYELEHAGVLTKDETASLGA